MRATAQSQADACPRPSACRAAALMPRPSAQPVGDAGDSAYIGVGWSEQKGVWLVHVRDPETKRQKCIGTFGDKGDAARA